MELNYETKNTILNIEIKRYGFRNRFSLNVNRFSILYRFLPKKYGILISLKKMEER